MANLRFSKRNEEWVRANPHLAVVVANLRAQAGMSERAIVETMRGYTRENHPRQGKRGLWSDTMVGSHYDGLVAKNKAPSYGDVRAAFAALKAGHLTLDGKTGQRIDFRKNSVEEGHSEYRKNIKSQFSAEQMERLNRKTVAGYLIHAETPATEWADPVAYITWEESQSYERTPPF